MNKFKFAVANFLLVLTFSTVSIFANNIIDNDKETALVAQNLTMKLKADLVSSNVSVKFTNIEKNSVSNTETILKGEALAVLPNDNTQLPIKFEANLNPVEEVVTDVSYAFLESNYAPTTDEDFLMKHLLKKIAADFKTEEVVIAIDGFDGKAVAGEKREFKGLAEVRIGEVEWQTIDFDVVMNSSNEASKIEYKLKK